MLKPFKLIHGEGEIKRIDSQIREAFKVLSKCPLRRNGVGEEVLDKICSLDFEHISSSGNTFIGKRQVIKLGLFTRRPPLPKYRVPTLIYSDRQIKATEWDWVYAIAIQPKVELLDDDELGSYINYFQRVMPTGDHHCGNMGLYKGKILLFDW